MNATLSALHRPAVRLLSTVAVSALVATQLRHLSGRSPLVFLFLVPVALAFYFCLKDPRLALVGVLATTVLGLYRYGVSLGPLDIRVTDLPYSLLFGWAVLLHARAGRRGSAVGQGYLVVLMAILGISLFPVLVNKNPELPELLVSWMRLVTTLSLIWLVPYVVRTPSDRRLVLNAFAVVGVAEILLSMLQLATSGNIGGRLRGDLGPNAAGLLGATLLALAFHSPYPSSRLGRWITGLVGLSGLLLSKSVGSIAAVGIALGLYGLSRRTLSSNDWLLRPARVMALLIGIVSLVSMLRPDQLPSSGNFDKSSTTHRVLLGTAGLEIFHDHPLVGVGWQRSNKPEVIGDPDLAIRLHRRFPNTYRGLFPENGASSVHNAYIQVLAEAGVIGFAALMVMLFGCRRRIRSLMQRLAGVDAELGRAVMVVMLISLVWWNDNALFGANPETVVVAAFLGLLASCGPSSEPQRATGRSGARQAAPIVARSGGTRVGAGGDTDQLTLAGSRAPDEI